MSSAKGVGRTIGLALLVQGLIAPLVYFRWMRPLTSPDYLTAAAGSETMVRSALLLTFLLGAMTFIVAITALPYFRQLSERLAFTYFALSVLSLATLAFESIALRNMLALSLEVAKAGGATDLLRTLGGLARTTWANAHFTSLLVAHGCGLVMWIILFRFALVPRWLSVVGLIGSPIAIVGVAMPLLGNPFSFNWILPAAPPLLALIAWLLVRGLRDVSPDNSLLLASHRTSHG